MVFLLASFVTSLFSIGNILPDTINLRSFAVTFSLIYSLNRYLVIMLVASGRASRVSSLIRTR